MLIDTNGGVEGRGRVVLLLTTHGNLPSAAAAEDADALLGHARLPARLVPHRFFITSSILDLTIVGVEPTENESTLQGQQPHYLKTCCKPSLDHGSAVYLLGHTGKNELVIGEGKVVIGTDNLIKLSTDGVTWCPGSAGFDAQGNLAFMICDPMKLASSSPTARSSSASSSSSHSSKKDQPMQFGIPISVVCDWLYQHWQGNLDEVSKPKLPLVRLMSSRSDHSSTSFNRRHVFKPADDENDDASVSSSQVTSKPKYQQASGSPANARISHDANLLVDLRMNNEQGISTPEIYESPRGSSCQSQKDPAPIQLLDINFVPRAPKTIFLPLPLKQMLSDENNAETSKPRNQSRENCFPSGFIWHRNCEADSREPTVAPLQEDCSSEGQSSSSPAEQLGYRNQDQFSSEEETMYSAETMESRNIPSPREKHVGRSQSCVNYSRWSSPRKLSVQNGTLRKQHTLIPVRKTHSQSTSLPQRSHDYLSPTVSSAMKKRNSMEQQQPPKPRRIIVQSSPKWMF